MAVLLDPDDTLDYKVDFSSWLGAGETIATHSATNTDGNVTIESSSRDNTTVTVWLTGGVNRTTAQVNVHIVTNAGRERDMTLTFRIWQR